MKMPWMDQAILSEAKRRGYIDNWDAAEVIGAPTGNSRLNQITRDGVTAVAEHILGKLETAGMLRRGFGPYYHPAAVPLTTDT